MDSDGNVTQAGSFTPTTFIMPGEASPSTTTAGSLRRDTDDHHLVMGTGSAAKRLGLVVGSGAAPTVTGEMTYDTATGLLKLYDGSAAVTVGATLYKYKTAGQNFTTTTFADVTATSGSVAFAVVANTAYKIDIDLMLTAVGTQNSGGVKFAFTTPAAFTAAQTAYDSPYTVGDLDVESGGTFQKEGGRITSLVAITSGVEFFGSNAYATAANGAAGVATGLVRLSLLFVNGANAGTVTLQAAQKTAAGTSTFTLVNAVARLVSA